MGMISITNLRQIVDLFRDDESSQLISTRWIGSACDRISMTRDPVSLLTLSSMLFRPLAMLNYPSERMDRVMGYIQPYEPLPVSYPNSQNDAITAYQTTVVDKITSRIEEQSEAETIGAEFVRMRRITDENNQEIVTIQPFIVRCAVVFDPSGGRTLTSMEDHQETDNPFQKVTYSGGWVTPEMLFNALDLWLVMDHVRDSEERKARFHDYGAELHAANRIIEQYGQQIEPKTIEHMQEVLCEISTSKKYTSIGTVAVFMAGACMRVFWEGIGPWRS